MKSSYDILRDCSTIRHRIFIKNTNGGNIEMNEKFDYPCKSKDCQEIGCGCSGVLEYFNRLINDVERLVDESQDLTQKTDNLLAKAEYTVDEAQRELASALVRFQAATNFLGTAPNDTCLCEGTTCDAAGVVALIGAIQASLDTIETGITNLNATRDLVLIQYEQLVLLLEQYEQCIRCGACTNCGNGSARVTCTCPRI